MNKRLKVALGVVATVTLAMTATPAFASTWDGNDIQWGATTGDRWSVSGDNFNFGGLFTQAWYDTIDDDTFDDGLQPYTLDDVAIGACTVADLSDAADGSGDKILTCDPESVDLGGTVDLSVTLEMRFFADHQTARQRLIVTNTTASAVTGTAISVYNNYYQDSNTNLSYTPTLGNRLSNLPGGNTSADDILTEADNVFVTDCPGTPCGPAYTGASVYQAFGIGASAPSFFVDPENYTLGGVAGDAGDETWLGYDIPDLAAGESVSIVTMVRTFLFLEGENDGETNTNALAASTSAVAFAEAGGWGCDGQVTAGIADAESIINYDCATPAALPTLPNTGVSTPASVTFGLLGGSALLALLGAAVVLATRRRAVN